MENRPGSEPEAETEARGESGIRDSGCGIERRRIGRAGRKKVLLIEKPKEGTEELQDANCKLQIEVPEQKQDGDFEYALWLFNF